MLVLLHQTALKQNLKEGSGSVYAVFLGMLGVGWLTES
jgi:hypothetical protein